MNHSNNPALSLATPFTLAWLLAKAEPQGAHREVLRRLRRHVLLPLAVVAALLGTWSATAPLSGAVVVNGQVQSELGRKTVSHQEGGIVRELFVRPGDMVRQGQALLVVGDVRNDAGLDLLRTQLDAQRLRAERSRAEMAFAIRVAWPSTASDSSEALARERALFDARRAALNEQVSALQQQMHDSTARLAALAAQLEASDRATQLAREELRINEPLADSGFIQRTRLMGLERNVADLAGRAEAARGQIAEARMQAGALASQIAQLRSAYQQRAADELKDATAAARELQERVRPSQDQVERQVVRAPVDGTVMSLRVSAAGTAVGPREPLLEIAPDGESLVVEVHLDPHDIDHVRAGGAAEVRLTAFDSRSTRLLLATVLKVAPDAVSDPATHAWSYAAQVEVSAAELAKQPRLRLQAGMPAEVFVTTPARTLLEYLLEPLGSFTRRAMREP